MLLDRESETATIGDVLTIARSGGSGSLVLRGEPGIGLSSLLQEAMASASDMRVTRITGVESEMQFALAGLQQLCAPLLGLLDRLPETQRKALGAAFGVTGGTSPDGYLIGLSVLSLLSEASQERPILGVIDDAQWIDQASFEALAFVAHRLSEESVALLFAVSEPTGRRLPIADPPELQVGGLDERAARALLASIAGEILADDVRDRLIEETQGNPLALLELAAGLTPDQLAGAAILPDPLSLGHRLEEAVLRQIRELPEETRILLILVACEPTGDAELVWGAAARLGISADAAAPPAGASGLLRLGPRITFRHPLVRLAVYAGASVADRRRAHRALADGTDEQVDQERRVRHLAAATADPDDHLASGLEGYAADARARGSPAAAAELLEEATRITADPGRRAARLLAAAQAEFAAGNLGRATSLLAEASPALGDELERAEAHRLRGAISLALGEGAEGAAMLLQAARRLEPLDVRRARDAHVQALEAAIYAGPIGSAVGLADAATAAASAPSVPATEQTGADLLLDGLGSLITRGHASAVPTIRRAIKVMSAEDDLHPLALGCLAAMEIWDDDGVHALTAHQVRLARRGGALVTLPFALAQLGGLAEVLAGRFDVAESHLSEAREITLATGAPGVASQAYSGELILSAWRGRTTRTRELADAGIHDAIARGLGRYVIFAQYALSVLEVGRGNYGEALTAALQVSGERALYLVTQTLPELVEAAARSGEPELAASACERLSESTLASGTDWGLGMLARSRALIASGADAEELYVEAIDRLQRCRAVVHLARAHLLWGECLRRARRQREARVQLSRAHDSFASMGAEAFAERARVELQAAGGRARRPTVDAFEGLTPQEARIAMLVSDGASNPEIASQLFISRRTVEYHLQHVFTKLGVSTRTQLARWVLGEREALDA